ncbi:peptidoglycan D,D-transpeptidase FtsI family protein [Georgenia faecalis]|uniref:Peptidoglycan D,D-transpeptidase FtsI family protein n=1 Tax=Georgenia faecalis TaxID=2483799 RepID=A0ABV9DDM3_9MICO|nr:penicillin-binding protein 2 [Georgenia faecalis]
MSGAVLVRRQNIVLIAVLVVLMVFGGRLVYVQAVEGPGLAAEALDERLARSTLQAPRGDIVDANGEILATSVSRYNIGVNQVLIREFTAEIDGEPKTGAVAAAAVLAPHLDRDPAELGAAMVGDSTFVYLEKGLTPDQWREIRELGIPGIEPEATTERIYPNGATAGNIVGFVGRDGAGLAGLELALDADLEGTDGSSVVEIGLHGQRIPTGQSTTTPAEPGRTVHTTIDRDIQFRAEEVIDAYTERYGAAWGAVVVEEIGTGRILALADSHRVDPGNYQDTPPERRGSRAAQAAYEPGSTGKLATFAAALDVDAVEPTTVFTTPDRLTMPSGQTFSDADPHATEDLTVAGILATSSNTGTVQVGDRMNDEERHAYLEAFGFGSTTGLGLPGETGGILADPEAWDGRQRYTTMFGQGMAVNLIQNTSVAATLGNGGVRVSPRIVDGYTGADGTFEPVETPEGVPVVREETAGEMLRLMEGVVSEEGTGVLGMLDGYRAAGKTGTAQVPDANGRLTQTVASFIGVAPAEAPRIAVGIVLYHPTTQLSSGIIAAPIFPEVANFTLRHLGVPPSQSAPEPYPLRAQ